MRSSGRTITYHAAQTRLWERSSSLRLSEISREVMGIYALLDREDSRAPANGRFEFQQRQSLAELAPTSTAGGDREVIARALELKQLPRNAATVARQ